MRPPVKRHLEIIVYSCQRHEPYFSSKTHKTPLYLWHLNLFSTSEYTRVCYLSFRKHKLFKVACSQWWPFRPKDLRPMLWGPSTVVEEERERYRYCRPILWKFSNWKVVRRERETGAVFHPLSCSTQISKYVSDLRTIYFGIPLIANPLIFESANCFSLLIGGLEISGFN